MTQSFLSRRPGGLDIVLWVVVSTFGTLLSDGDTHRHKSILIYLLLGKYVNSSLCTIEKLMIFA